MTYSLPIIYPGALCQNKCQKKVSSLLLAVYGPEDVYGVRLNILWFDGHTRNEIQG